MGELAFADEGGGGGGGGSGGGTGGGTGGSCTAPPGGDPGGTPACGSGPAARSSSAPSTGAGNPINRIGGNSIEALYGVPYGYVACCLF